MNYKLYNVLSVHTIWNESQDPLSRRIEHLDKYCRRLRILYLQDNAIQRLENLHRLKYLGKGS